MKMHEEMYEERTCRSETNSKRLSDTPVFRINENVRWLTQTAATTLTSQLISRVRFN